MGARTSHREAGQLRGGWGWLQAPQCSEEKTEAESGAPSQPRSHSREAAWGWAGGTQVGAGLVTRTSGGEDRGPEAGAPTPGSRRPRIESWAPPVSGLRFGASPSAASLSTCSWGPTTHPSPDVFFGAGCVFTRCQPASPNSTVTSLWAQVSAVDLLSVDGGLVSQKPGARARAGAPFSGVDHLCIGSGIILSGASFPFPVSRDRACVSVLVLFPERRLAFRRRAGCNRTRVGFEKRPDLSNPHPHRVSPSPRDSQPPSARPARDSAASLGVPWPPCHVSREWRGVASRLSRRTFALLQGTTLVTEK